MVPIIGEGTSAMHDGDLIILLGAGCSVEAGIPSSSMMVQEVEHWLESDAAWSAYQRLYIFLKAALVATDVMRGQRQLSHIPDIERIVNTLTELEKNTECALYPFIAGWHHHLASVAGPDFRQIKDFRNLIVKQLREWIAINTYNKATYYDGFFRLCDELKFPLRIFSLNYDICLEMRAQQHVVELGFNDDETWDFRRFEAREEEAPHIYLYKLHGSITWYRDRTAGNILKLAATPQATPDLIFGTDYKMQYIDPYLFYAYQLRRFSLEARFILTIGYGYHDEHINGIITQALKHNPERVLIAISPTATEDTSHLNLPPRQIKPYDVKASAFLSQLTIENIADRADTAAPPAPF
ncbi:MAG: SIR2 family protein [Acidobacteriota bacterium]